MYQPDDSIGASPLLATVRDTPFVPYVGSPEAAKSLEAPEVKSIDIDLPSAVSAGQVCDVGLQLLDVWARLGHDHNKDVMVAIDAKRTATSRRRSCERSNMGGCWACNGKRA